jgi:glycosyltransferase involved in cell wall biosynthesis
MRVLVIHNQLWAHYKSKLFSEIHQSMRREHPESAFLVAHIALYEASRGSMQDQKSFPYEYPYEVLFNKSLDQVGFKERLKSLFATFNTFKPTVLNVTGWFDWAQVLLMVYARSKGVKIVLSSESSTLDHHRSALKEKIKKQIVSMADAFFCFGKTSAEYLAALGISKNKIAVSNAAVIDETFVRQSYDAAVSQNKINSNTREKTFVYVGRLAAEKNLTMLLQVFLKIQASVQAGTWKLLFVGDGPERRNLENLAANSTKPENITFAGGFPWYEVPAWLAQSDVLILPSTSEPWGLVVNEAMVCGLPVIVSQTCGCVSDLVSEGENGFIVDPETAASLETAMTFFVNNPDQINEMGLASERIITPFNSVLVAQQMVNCYAALNLK